MMATVVVTPPAEGRTVDRTLARSVEEQFLDLVCSDADLVRAEFDAIIAAGWPERPVPPTRSPVPRPPVPPADGPGGWVVISVAGPVSEPGAPGTGGRERSPPRRGQRPSAGMNLLPRGPGRRAGTTRDRTSIDAPR